MLRVLPGEAVPVDGVIIGGQTSIDQAVMTGESLPVDKAEGDEVASGTVNQFGAFDMRATRWGEDSSIQRMVRLVQSADAGKAKIVGLADRWATWIVVIALSSAALTWLVTGEILRAVTILVVFLPLRAGKCLPRPRPLWRPLAMPQSMAFWCARAMRWNGWHRLPKWPLTKQARLHTARREVAEVCTILLSGLARPYMRWRQGQSCAPEHPLGKAIVRGYGKTGGPAPAQPTAFAMLPGRGVTAQVAGGSCGGGGHTGPAWPSRGAEVPPAAMQQAAAYTAQGCTVIYLRWTAPLPALSPWRYASAGCSRSSLGR